MTSVSLFNKAGVNICSDSIKKEGCTLPYEIKTNSREEKHILSDDLFRGLVSLFHNRKNQSLVSPNLYDDEDPGIPEICIGYPEMIFVLQNENAIDGSGNSHWCASLMIRVERIFSGVTFMHLEDFSFEEEKEIIKNYFNNEFKKVNLKLKFT